MTPGQCIASILIVALSLVTAADSAATLLHQYLDDFSTTQYRDAENTSAWWDTLAGEIKLFPVAIELIGNYNSPGNAYDVMVVDDLAFLADDAAGLHVIDISDPSDPVHLGTADTPGSARGVVLAGVHAYVADGASGLQVVDIQNPTAPIIVGAVDMPGFAHDVAIAGSHAYVAQSNHGLQVVYIGNPTDPLTAGSVATSDWARAVTVDAGYAYVADGLGGMQVVDVTDPDNPVVVGSFPQADYAFGITVLDQTAYLADGAAGLQILTVAEPTTPSLLGSGEVPGSCRDVFIAGDYAYLAAGEAGFQLLDVSDPQAPVTRGGLDLTGNANGVSYDGELVSVAAGSGGLYLLTVDPDGFDPYQNRVQSLIIDTSDDPIVRARLSSVQEDTIRWELSADAGDNWEQVPPDGSWHSFATPGRFLLWRSTHIYLDNGINPACSQLRIEWEKLYSHAVIDSIRDIPNDQGLQVRIHFTASRFDSLGSATPITEYAIYRRIDPVLSNRTSPTPVAATNRRYYPPGDWDYVLSVPADAEAHYATVVPTLADSTAWGGVHFTTFFIRARTETPGTYFDSPPDSGYSMNNLLPSVPEDFSVDYGSESNHLVWSPSADTDFDHFRVYRAGQPIFMPEPANHVHSTADTEWTDNVTDSWHMHYLLTAVDDAGNESPAAFPWTMTPVANSTLPTTTLHQNNPNPFNPLTTIVYEVKDSDTWIHLAVYDLQGRLVRVLVDGPRTSGRHRAVWNGQDQAGRHVAAGVYTYRLEAPGYNRTLKMTLLP